MERSGQSKEVDVTSDEIVERPNLQIILSTLKDFQLKTVQYVFNRMYQDSDPAKQFLIADECYCHCSLV